MENEKKKKDEKEVNLNDLDAIFVTSKFKNKERRTTKYEIYHAIKAILPKAMSWKQFEETLKIQGIYL
jgi:hypothetical protein